MTDREIMIRTLDGAYHEFDRLMLKALEEMREHVALERDYQTLVVRHQAARAAGTGFVFAAACECAPRLSRSAA